MTQMFYSESTYSVTTLLRLAVLFVLSAACCLVPKIN